MKKNLQVVNFGNRQFVRFGWGYQKMIAFIGLINTTAYIVTALAVSNLVEFTWGLIFTLFTGTFLTLTITIYLLSRSGVLQNESIQTFDERVSKLYHKQANYSAAKIAQYMQMPLDQLEKEVEQLENSLFKTKQS